MATTPAFSSVRVFVGGKRTVLTEAATWVEMVMGDIGVHGREKEDSVCFVSGVGWRLTDARTFGSAAYETGVGADGVLRPGNSNALLAVYADGPGESLGEVPNQRYLSELGFAQGDQTTQGDWRIVKQARPTTGFTSDISAFPTPSTGDTVPLDRCLVTTDEFDAVDDFATSFTVRGNANLGALYRICFPSIPGTTKTDVADSRHGLGKYSLTFHGDGVAFLYELTDVVSGDSDPTWTYRQTFRYCGDREVVGFDHIIKIDADAVLDADGNITGKVIRFGFGSQRLQQANPTLQSIVAAVAISRIEAPAVVFSAFEYRVPNPRTVPPTLARMPLRAEARQDTKVTFGVSRTVFAETGILRCKTFVLRNVPKDGVIHTQIFGVFPAGTAVNINLYGAKSGTACTVATSPVDTDSTKFGDFNVIPGERSYYMTIQLDSSSNRLKSPTIKRVAYVREAGFTTIDDPEVDLLNVVEISTTGAGANPSTNTLGLICYDLTGGQNGAIKHRSGQWIQVEADLGPVDPEVPEGPRKKTVLFRGKIREIKRQTVAGKGKQGFGRSGSDLRSGNLTKFTIKAVSEIDFLMKRLAPGRLDLAFDRDAATLAVGNVTPMRVSDAVRYLMLAAMPAERLDIPDIPIPFPIDTDFPTFIEKHQPVVPLAMELWQKFAGGYMVLDYNASRVSDDEPTTEGMMRFKIAAHRPFRPVIEFCREPVVSGVVVVDRAAYPDRDGTVGSGEEATPYKIPRTFWVRKTLDEWIEPPEYSQIIVRGVANAKNGSPIMIGTTGAYTVTLNNWVAATFNVERREDGTLPPAQGATGGPPAPDPTHRDYTTGDVVTLEHSDPMLNSDRAVVFVARRLFDMKVHAKDWAAGEAPVVLLTKETTGDPLQVNDRVPYFGDIAIYGLDGEGDPLHWVVTEQPSILIDGRKGGRRFTHGFFSIYSAPPNNSYRAAYGSPPS